MRPALSVWLITLAAFLTLLPGHMTQAEVVRVRSGEHPGFSRLVFDLPAGTSWTIGRSPQGYELRLDGLRDGFDLAEVFTRIPRTRLRDIAPAGNSAGLVLTVSPGIHARASQTEGGRLILDLADGPAPEGSAFEVPLTATVSNPARPRLPPMVRPGDLATLTYRPTLRADASLPIYWRNKYQAPALPPDERPGIGHALPAPASPNGPVLPIVIPPPSPEPPSLPDADVLAVEHELRRQVSRAAAQGLAEVSKPPAATGPDEAAPAGAATARPTETASPPLGEGHDVIAFRAETSMDRDGRSAPAARPVTNDGAACLTDEDLALRDWGTGEDPAMQISVARNSLIGEFDRPDSVAVRRLARLYLHFGMGAEAAQTISAFKLSAEDTGIVLGLARVMDGQPVTTDSSLATMGECNSAAALWAVLASPVAPPLHKVNLPAVVRSFSGLPPHLRQQLGRRLSDRLIAMGAPEGAKSVRDALARVPIEGNRELGLIDAGLEVQKGQPARALDSLDQLVAGNDDIAVRALVLGIQTRLAQNQPVTAEHVEAIAALAFERRRGDGGIALAELEIASRAAAGQFDTAFLRLAEEVKARPEWPADPTRDGLFVALAAQAGDASFLTTYFARRDLAGKLGVQARLELAARLLQLGFADEVRALLADMPAGATTEGVRLLARAELALGNPSAVLASNGAAAVEDEVLRAEALAAAGDYRAAASVFAAAGSTDAAATAAWNAGDLALAAELSPARADMATILMPPVEDTSGKAKDSPPSLAAGRAALSDSTEFRAGLTRLLATPTPDATQATDAAVPSD